MREAHSSGLPDPDALASSFPDAHGPFRWQVLLKNKFDPDAYWAPPLDLGAIGFTSGFSQDSIIYGG